jgi:hypothetical protein
MMDCDHGRSRDGYQQRSDCSTPRIPPSLASTKSLQMSTSLGWCHPGFELQFPTFCTLVASRPMPISPFLSSWLLLGVYLLQENIRPHGSRDFQCKKRLISDDAHTYKEIKIFRLILFQNTNCVDCHVSHLTKIILPRWTSSSSQMDNPSSSNAPTCASTRYW